MYFSYKNLNFRYQPFPIGLAKPLMEDSAYETFVDSFPPLDIFEDYKAMRKPGDKFTLSEKENPRTYRAFVKSSPVWREFYDWIKSDAFVFELFDALKARNIDLGYKQLSWSRRLKNRLKSVRGGRLCSGNPKLRTRFEFSALPADGGHLLPHTDSLPKVVTMIVSMAKPDDWDTAYGGGTDVNQPKEDRLQFNWVNRLADFDDMKVLHTYDYSPNQGVVFVKTFNSWHSVRPMTGIGSKVMRRTLTINIEDLS